jgi:type I restriction enzyme, S subunit
MKIGDICEVVRGSSPRPRDDSRYYDGPVPRLMIADVTRDGKYVSAKIDSLTELGAKQSRPMSRGEVVIAVSGAPGLPAVLAHDACIHDGFAGLRKLDTTQVNIDFLYRYLIFVRLQSSGRAVGAIFKNLTTEQIRETIIPDFPIAQQKHIAAILDQAEALRSLRRQSIGQLDALARSVFLEMFGDPATNPKGWNKCRLTELCEASDDIRCGPFGTQLGREEYQESGVPLWGIKHVNVHFKIPTSEFLSKQKAKELAAYSLIPGDIVMTRKGTIGNCSVFPADFELGIMHSDLLRIRVGKSKSETNFLSHQLQHSKDIEHQISLISGGAIMAGINVTKLKGIFVLSPPLALQQEFADRIQAIEALKAQHRESLAKMDTLFASLQHRAFRGEL